MALRRAGALLAWTALVALVGAPAEAAAGGWTNYSTLSGHREFWVAGGGLTPDNQNTSPDDAFRPALACNPDGDCLVAFPEVTFDGSGNDPANSIAQLHYAVWRGAERAWTPKAPALLPSRSDEANSRRARGQAQPHVAALQNQGWAIAYRNYAYLADDSGACCAQTQSIYMAYVSQPEALAGGLWMGEARGYGVHASRIGGWKRFPVIAADTSGTVVAVWGTNNDELADAVYIGKDKDLLTTSFSLSDGDEPYGRLESPTPASSLTQVTSVNTGIETDTLQDRIPVLAADPRTGRMVAAATVTLTGGHADIFISEAVEGSARACSWSDRVRVTQFDGKDADVTIASSPFKDLWLAVWEHRDLGFRWARLGPNDDGFLQVEEMGFVDPAPFAAFQRDEKASLVADPLRDGYWSLFYRWQVPGRNAYRLVYRVSTDDGRTWGDAYFADDLEAHAADERLFRIAVTASPLGDYVAATMWENTTNSDHGSFKVTVTTHEDLFGQMHGADRVPTSFSLVDFGEVQCTDVELPRDGSRANLTDYIRAMAPSQTQCIHLVGSGAIHMNVNVLTDLESFSEYRETNLCPFDFVAIRTTTDLGDGNHVGPAPRVCAAGQLETLVVSGGDAYFIASNDRRGLDEDGGAGLPATLEAWITPAAETLVENGDGGSVSVEAPAFEVRFAASFEEIQNAFLDESFSHGEVVVTAAEIEVAYELRVRKGANITLTGRPSTGAAQVHMRGYEFLSVEIGAVLWGLSNFDFREDTSVFKGLGRFGGMVLVSGRAGRIENCKFRDASTLNLATESRWIQVGGGLTVEGEVDELVDLLFSNLRAVNGAAIAIMDRGSIGLIHGCVFSGNRQMGTSTGHAGAMLVRGFVDTIRNSNFTQNTCGGGGGAISVGSSAQVREIINTNFVQNRGSLGGGAIDFRPKSLAPSRWAGGTFYANEAGVNGGAILAVEVLPSPAASASCPQSQICMEDLRFDANHAPLGGAVMLGESPLVSSLRISGCSFAANEATQWRGGALVLDGAASAEVSDSLFASNNASVSGGALAVLSGAQASFVGAFFENNGAQEQGGAIYAGAGTDLTVVDTSFVDNAARLTCREQTGCEMSVSWSDRVRCGALRIAEGGADDPGAFETAQCVMNQVQQAASTLGCTKGVGGAVYMAAGVNAHVHRCRFQARDSLPSIARTATFTSPSGEVLYFADEAGRHIFAEARFRLSETRFDGGGNSFAPSTAVMGCPNTCATGGSCLADEDGFFPSVQCVCLGAYEGDDAYAEGGCELRRVRSVRAQTAQIYEHGEYDADGFVDLSWSWDGDVADYFIVSRTSSREASGTRSAEGCITANEAAFVVADCVMVENAKSLRMGLRIGEGSFFRVVAVVDGASTQVSDAVSLASIVCQPGAQRVRTDEDGAFECEMCPRASYVESLEEGCVACPNELQTTMGVATSVDDCVSPSGFFTMTSEVGDTDVISCQEGLNCTASGISLETLELLPGFWRASLTSRTVHPCPVPAYCTGGSGLAAGKDRRALSIWSEPLYCAPGHAGPFCSTCIDGYSKGRNGLCTMCTEEKVHQDRVIFGVIAAFVLVAWVCIIAFLLLAALNSRSPAEDDSEEASRPASVAGTVKQSVSAAASRVVSAFRRCRGPLTITIGLVQVTTGFQRVFGPTYTWFSNWDIFTSALAWANLDASRIPIVSGCAVHDNQTNRLLLATILPLLLILLLALAFAVTRCIAAPTETARDKLASTTWYLVAILLFLVFPSVNTTIVQTFVCDSFEDGSRALRFDHGTDCDDMGWTSAYAIFMAVAYVVGPVLLFVVLIAHSSRPAVQGASFLRRLYVRNGEKRPGKWNRIRRYYEVFELLRKYLLTSSVLLVADGTVGQLAFAQFVCFLATLLQTILMPYAEPQDNILATVMHAQLFCLLCALLISTVVIDLSALEISTVIILVVGPILALCFIVHRLTRPTAKPSTAGNAQGEERRVDDQVAGHGSPLSRPGFEYEMSGASEPHFYREKRRGSTSEPENPSPQSRATSFEATPAEIHLNDLFAARSGVDELTSEPPPRDGAPQQVTLSST